MFSLNLTSLFERTYCSSTFILGKVFFVSKGLIPEITFTLELKSVLKNIAMKANKLITGIFLSGWKHWCEKDNKKLTKTQ